MWILYACLAAVFASAVAILAKIGIEGVNSNVATAIRTVVVVILAWTIVFATGTYKGIPDISKRSYTFLILSGIATGLSWMCYYKALQIGPVSKVVPIDKLSVALTMILAFFILHETYSAKEVIGAVLIGAGTLLMVL